MIICTQLSSVTSQRPIAIEHSYLYTELDMPRNRKMRYCRKIDGFNLYKPSGIPLSQMEIVELGLDELEAMRLCDLDGMQQEEAADAMRISRGTVQRLLEVGRRKTLDALVHGKALSLADADHVCISPPAEPPRGRGGRWGGGNGHGRGGGC